MTEESLTKHDPSNMGLSNFASENLSALYLEIAKIFPEEDAK